MNKICNLSALGILLLVSFLLNCKKESGTGEIKDFHLAMADTILSQYNAERPNWDWSFRTEGKVNIRVKDSMISIEHNPDNGEELATYFLQTGKKDHHFKTGLFGLAEVIFLDRNLIVNSLETKKTLLFSIKVDPDPYYLKYLNNVKQYKGFGLGVRKTNRGGAWEKAPYCSCEPAGSLEDLCISGGPDALSCSTANLEGSCRVSCSGQTFACCDKKMD